MTKKRRNPIPMIKNNNNNDMKLFDRDYILWSINQV